MTDHYAKALQKLAEARGATQPALRSNLLAEAQVHATLADARKGTQPEVEGVPESARTEARSVLHQELAAAHVLGAWSFTDDETGDAYTLSITEDGRASVLFPDPALLPLQLWPAPEAEEANLTEYQDEALPERPDLDDDFSEPVPPSADDLAQKVAANVRQPKGKK